MPNLAAVWRSAWSPVGEARQALWLRRACVAGTAALALGYAVLLVACGSSGKATYSVTAPPPPTSMPAASTQPARLSAAELRALYARPPAEWPEPEVDPGIPWREIGLLPPPPHPKDNPFTAEKAELGKLLFFDGRLSGTGQMACVSCHVPEMGWHDGRTTAMGHDARMLKRNTPSLLNAAYQERYFWDGRAESLEALVREVVLNPREHHGNPADIVRAVSEDADYRKRFAAVFAKEQPDLEQIAAALACFVRTVTSGRSDFDKFMKGDRDLLSDAAVRGLHLFRTEARCMNCHHGPNFTDNRFHDLGLSYYGRALQDLGRYEVTKEPEDAGRFKTPSLRDVGRTAPYMHLGLFDLDGVLNMYNAGMATLRRKPEQQDDPLFPTKSIHLRKLNLSPQDKADLKAFLHSLSEPRQRVRPHPIGQAPKE